MLVVGILALRTGSSATVARATGITIRINHYRVSIVQVRVRFIISIVGHLIWKSLGIFIEAFGLRRLVGVEVGGAGGGGVGTRVYCGSATGRALSDEGAEEFNA